MRVLIVTPTVPWPPNWGFGIRVYQFIRHLTRHHEVSVLCYAQPGDEPKADALRAECHAVHTVPSPISSDRAKRIAQLGSLFRRQSYQTASVGTPAMSACAAQLFAAERFDVIEFESSQMSSLPVPDDVVTVVDEHNIEYELLHRMYQTERSALRKLFNWTEYRKFAREERASWHRADACVVTSEREREIVASQAPGQHLHVAPNGVDVDYFTPPPPATVGSDEIVFTGLLSYRPNVDAVTYFVRQVLPLVLERRPAARFSVVGIDAHDEVRRLAGPHVDIVGEVPDVRPYVRRAALFAVPLRMGSGTRLKILEGLAMGKGVVSTTIGCEGIDVRHGEHLLVADDPGAFASAVVSMMDDRELARRLGQAGRTLVEQRYSWTSIVDELERFLELVLDRGPTSAPVRQPPSDG